MCVPLVFPSWEQPLLWHEASLSLLCSSLRTAESSPPVAHMYLLCVCVCACAHACAHAQSLSQSDSLEPHGP